MINFTQDDVMLVLRQSAISPRMKIKIEVLNDADMTTAGTIWGTVGGSFSIDGSSDVRRSGSIEIHPTLVENIKIQEGELIWLDKDLHIYVGLYDFLNEEYRYWSMGYYVYTDASIEYNATSNSISLNIADFWKKIDGTKNGQLGALTVEIPAYEENDDGSVASYNTIRDVIISTLENMAGITDYLIDEIGTKLGLEYYNDDYETYRENNEDWNAVPYDLEFSAGCSVADILVELRDLYSQWEMFFEPESNIFTCQMIPNGDDDDAVITNDFFQRVLISESTDIDMTTVRNVCEVWGQVIETDFYSEDVTYSDGVYSADVTSYVAEDDDDPSYTSGDTVALKVPSANDENSCINLCELGAIPIRYQSDDSAVEAGAFEADTVYCFKIRKIKEDDEYIYVAYYLGQWQAHAVNVLTDGSTSDETTTVYGTECTLYSEEYFYALTGAERIDFMVVEDSPFTVQKLGVILDVKTGDEYDNITSNDLAAERAEWENWKNARMTDTISIQTIFVPFYDVNQKVTYQPINEDAPCEYMIQSVSHDLDGYTSTLSMYRYYPYYMS